MSGKVSAAHWVSHHEDPYVKTCTQYRGGGGYGNPRYNASDADAVAYGGESFEQSGPQCLLTLTRSTSPPLDPLNMNRMCIRIAVRVSRIIIAMSGKCRPPIG